MKFKVLILSIFLAGIFLAGCSSDDKKVSDEDQKQEDVVKEEEQTDADTEEVAEETEPEVEEEVTETEEVTAPETETGDVVSKSFEGISFEVPAFAEEMQTGDIGYPIVSYMLDAMEGANFNVVVETLPEPMTVDEYVGFATEITGFDYISIENYTSNGMDWNESISIEPESGAKLNQRTFIVDNKAYVFSYASLPENYENYADVFIQITESVTVD